MQTASFEPSFRAMIFLIQQIIDFTTHSGLLDFHSLRKTSVYHHLYSRLDRLPFEMRQYHGPSTAFLNQSLSEYCRRKKYRSQSCPTGQLSSRTRHSCRNLTEASIYSSILAAIVTMAEQSHHAARGTASYTRSIGISQRVTPLEVSWTGEMRTRYAPSQSSDERLRN